MKLEELKNKTKDAVDYLVQSLESGHSEALTQYLGAMARFHTYSFGNVMLIARQKPDATQKRLFWVPMSGGRWRIDWPKTNRNA